MEVTYAVVYATPLNVKDGMVTAAETQLSMEEVPFTNWVPPVMAEYVSTL